MEAPVSGKRVGIVRLQMVREERTLYGMGAFDKPEKAVETVRPLIGMSDREMVVVMSLNTNLEPLAVEIAAVGGINSCCIDIKNIFKGAILSNAACVICFHNHPSGNPRPSREDFMITQRMKMAGEILGVSEEDNEAMRQGRDLENYVAQRFCESAGVRARHSNMMYRSKENPFMIADVDRLVVGEEAGLECKTANAYNADKWKDGQIASHYLIQCCHYMAVTGKKAWYIAVVIMGREFKYVRIERDEAMIQKLTAIEKEFWEKHVLKGVMPAPDGSEACDKLLAQYYHS